MKRKNAKIEHWVRKSILFNTWLSLYDNNLHFRWYHFYQHHAQFVRKIFKTAFNVNTYLI